MDQVFHILQWIVSLIAVAALCYLNYWVLRAIVLMFKKERAARVALVVFVVGMLMAAIFQRLRIGFWDWPDVEYQIEAVDEGAIAE